MLKYIDRVLGDKNLKDRLQFSKRSVYNLLRKVIGIDFPIALSEIIML